MLIVQHAATSSTGGGSASLGNPQLSCNAALGELTQSVLSFQLYFTMVNFKMLSYRLLDTLGILSGFESSPVFAEASLEQ